jgi:signal transduction histidine kinase
MISATNNDLAARKAVHANIREPLLNLTLQPDWSLPCQSEHIVQFYETDAFLLHTLSEYIGTGLSAGLPCLVVATAPHRLELDERLQAAGIDVSIARASGMYVTLDAAETLATFMAGCAPDANRFSATVGRTIAQLTHGSRAVRVFGEMVGLLCLEGQYDAAVQLEALWNELHAMHAFALFCAYPIHSLGDEALPHHLGGICAAHARVIPAESYTALTNADDRLRTIIQLQQKARSLEAEIAERQAAEASLRATKNILEVQVADLRRLHELSVRLTGTLEIETILDEVLAAALAVHGTHMGLLWLCDPQRQELKLHVSQGFDDTFLAHVMTIPPGGGACGTCYARQQRIVVEDLEIDPIFAGYRQAARLAGFRAVHSTPLKSRNGTIIGVLSVHFSQPRHPSERETRLIDLYAQMAADAIENARLYQRAQDAIQVRDHFLSIAAHELKTPLTSLIGTAQLLQRRSDRDGLVTSSAAKAMHVIITQAKRLNKLILSLLDVSRIDAGRLTIERVPLDLGLLVRRVVEELQPTLDKHTVEYQLPRIPMLIEGDEVRLEQVVQNLLVNAIKYSPNDGPITVHVEHQEHQARLIVSDCGMGIPKEDQPHLFERFYRASNADMQYMSGMGIGLYVVKEIVTLHGGTVAVESREGAGSTFVVGLPLQG